MRWALLPGRLRQQPIWERLDQAAKRVNPFLLIAAVLLALVNLSVYSALEIVRHHPPRAATVPPAGPPIAQGQPALLPPAQD